MPGRGWNVHGGNSLDPNTVIFVTAANILIILTKLLLHHELIFEPPKFPRLVVVRQRLNNHCSICLT